jgi:hypothetical protein
MANEILKRDQNRVTVIAGITDDSDQDIVMVRQDPITKEVLVKDTALESLIGFDIPEYDYIALSYTGDNLTGVVYKTGGSGGTTVATLVLAYSGSNLTSVTKS